MLYTIALVFLGLWILGLTSAPSIGGLIHVLLVIAVAALLLQIIRGRRVV